jgi:putative ABC transport system permease protein
VNRATLAHLRRQAIVYGAFNCRAATGAVRENKVRAGLTSLGILFGVASVIAMLAIGKGAEQEILEQMRVLGSNNVVITPIVEQSEGKIEREPKPQVEKFSPGLTYADAQSIPRVIPVVDASSAEIVVNTSLTREGWRRSGKVVGVDTTYFRLTNLELGSGRWFTRLEVEHGLPVAIVGYGVRSRFFTTEDPLGKRLKVGSTWVTVIGVLKDRRLDEQFSARLGIRDANMDVYVPVHTMLRRFRNRALLTESDMEAEARAERNDIEQEEPTEEQRAEQTNLHQLDRIIVRVTESRFVPAVASITQRLLERRHNTVVDFEVTVPELLLRQERRTKTIFNVVLGAIASISLIVGGIGIMNIMLATVLERTREVGVRRAVGATQKDILTQFLSEAVLISVAGGVAGIMVGGGLSAGIERFAGIQTIVSTISVVVAFGVSFSVGLVFGIVPAYRAARRDPVLCLRHE